MTRVALSPSLRLVDHPVSVVAAILLFTLGSLNYPMMPLIVGAISDQYHLTSAQAGLVATADTFGMFVVALSALYWIRRVDWRHAAFLFGLLLVTAHIASAFSTTLPTLMTSQFCAGFCGGALMALGNIVVGDTITRERNVALLSLIQMAVVAIAFMIVPGIVAVHGAVGLFLFMGVYVLPVLAVGQFVPRQGTWQPAEPKSDVAVAGNRSAILWVIGGTLPVFFFFLAYGASWTYIERMGVAAGLSHATVGNALSVSVWAGVIGSAVSWVFATRYGQVRPLLVTVIFQLFALGMLVFYLHGSLAFCAAASLYFFFINFAGAYQIAVALNVDRTGRGAIVFLLMLKAGVTVGPFVASLVVRDNDYSGPIFISAFFFTLSFLLSWWVTRAARNSGTFMAIKLQAAT